MLLLMDSKSQSQASFSGDEHLHFVSALAENSPDSFRKCKRRENNRAAAQRSRKKQTERADELHKELQSLEHSNAAYEKEIASLREEIEKYTAALQRHEPHCPLHTSPCLEIPPHSSTSPAALTLASNLTPVPASHPPPELQDSTDWSDILASIL
ncbi:basic leucine zipper transcriptional factor ATF-like 3 isoform X2 [Brienomyrus brachyistius]|uniref:basic leucine zipper transcriptional factor ATF-like 3 isoform X2 n=1 Tax=Brienomyrus brachyistius TaxID=42636 RepID=UPI0020B2D506|nr:basic leucine zipper transcriptional factor ATF-like 3 isoform X2 [Brienomyrus brachyistius]